MSQQTEEQTINVGVIGAGGRMGRMLIEAVQDNPQTTLNAAIERQGSSLVGADAGEVAAIGRLNVQIVDDLKAVINDIDVLIDFSLPDATEQNMQICAANKVAMVIGTTGFNEQQEQVLKEASKQIAIVYAGNYSTGVNLSLKLLAMAAKAFGNDADVEVIEAHHKHKIDAPSGTAYMMAEAVAEARGQNLKDVAIYGREGQTGEREAGSIGIHAIRGGEIIGDHTVMFIADGEVVEITHRARARMTFAAGAVRAATWVIKQEVGQYNMQDVLGLND
ncbi:MULTISPECIES: 4-hydroxy-tetrahydrodipicolinate reductase [Psychrobacter]|jgi:4-hydroxy-tetrahydrodipicolinate reductase|uniref:4-hydroxy-tetrahydrodipicolinate reductase n=1 Tax=Psychrobacter faecalis TaxID=180588 RepID=A0ABT9HK11_9GAMM|nr:MULTISPECIES: 4-hydroxy-tetrahydrodipicolinate reductase [Psychrobacter]MCG3861054.1 4-hydroxy-tetrahydrodipicolinate reductase [Psychrobacter sp. Ps5]MDP4545655.1 4-hydroxy-tetrahydrodipicolinate reductase [Psychrobacter faecalis]OAP67038.1 4-hydroxy-tetrahydrodipicolinate reductase [Psychrobacter sp. SHUES1]PKG86965.1 4-hydroxy-tetrahydrodipicolinate reductase [Psychrobacter sp. Sarcosine-02u-2]WLW66398.1 4-hydroxy-tetrahydrodipicolinate reductase [Psychrobacter sp. van23A]